MERALNKTGEFIATIAFMGVVVAVVGVIGYIVFQISEGATTRPDEITTAEACRSADYAWHTVDGCMTHEMFREQYID